MVYQNPSLFRPRFLTFLVALFALLHAADCKAQTWREVQSPHFRVITDGSERDGREVCKEFEQMRSIFEVRLHNAILETGAPLLIIAVREQGLHALGPQFWRTRDHFAGLFFRGWERQFALVRLDAFGDDKQAVVFHEYTHSILHANLHWLPLWLDEGLAEFYGYTRFQSDHVYVGAPTLRMAHLRSETLIPLKQMLVADGTTYLNDDQRGDLFYAEAWAMVHYMNFGLDGGNAVKFNAFIKLLESGTPQSEAFRQIFGDLKAFEEQLSSYIAKYTINVNLSPPTERMDVKSFPAKVLTVAEADYNLGSFSVGAHDPSEARKFLMAAESADPALAGPHEELGFILWREGKDAEARAQWQKAVAADPACYRSAFALLMSATSLKEQTQQQLEQTQHALEAINQQAPNFAPALVELALIQWRLGHTNAAYKSARAAEKLEPWRAGYHILSGNILLQGQQPKLAADDARLVAARWPGADHDEAVDLWDQIPPSARGDGPALTLAVPPDSTVVRGTIVSTSCDKGGLHLVLQPAAPDASPLTLLASGKYESGFSDTLWVGEDHYTSCFHVAGLPAVVAYKASDSGPAKLMELEVRDDLPKVKPAPSVMTAQP